MPIYSMSHNVNNHPEATVLQHLTDHVRAGGVIDPETDMVVGEPAGGGLNVDVSSGHAYVKKTGTNAYPIRNTSTVTIPITANSSGSPRITSIVVYRDLTATPVASAQGADVVFFEAVDGTPAGSPVAPSVSQIEAAIGATNPYLVLDEIYVGSGVTGISATNITRKTPRVFLRTSTPIYTAAFATPWTPNFNNSSQQKITLTGNLTVNEPDNMQIGDVMLIDFYQDATGGRTVTFDFATISTGGADPEPDGTPSSMTSIAIRRVSATQYHVQYVDVGVS